MTRRYFAGLIGLASGGILAAQSGKNKKSYILRGKVESVDTGSKTMTINHGKVDGWMDAMTMKYKVDNADAFRNVKVGDTVEATVYENNYTLYRVHLVNK